MFIPMVHCRNVISSVERNWLRLLLFHTVAGNCGNGHIRKSERWHEEIQESAAGRLASRLLLWRRCPAGLVSDRLSFGSLAALAAAGLIAWGARSLLVLLAHESRAGFHARIVFWSSLVLLGVVATAVGNRVSSQFVFTWPLSLLAIHQLTLAALFWARQPQRADAAGWLGAVAAGLLVLSCGAYYELTRRLSLAPAWYFLPTFLAAWPLAIPSAKRSVSPRSFWNDLVWFFLVFSLYFWVSGSVMLWRTAVTR
jgi:hypothetical protein